jgi:hypothetical protein
MTTKVDDEIIEELRKRRQAHAESLGYDLRRITEDLQRREDESGARVVERPRRKPEVVPGRSSA